MMRSQKMIMIAMNKALREGIENYLQSLQPKKRCKRMQYGDEDNADPDNNRDPDFCPPSSDHETSSPECSESADKSTTVEKRRILKVRRRLFFQSKKTTMLDTNQILVQ